MPSCVSDGQCITFKDYNGSLSPSNIVLKATARKSIGGNSSVTLNSKGLGKRLAYVDGISNLIRHGKARAFAPALDARVRGHCARDFARAYKKYLELIYMSVSAISLATIF